MKKGFTLVDLLVVIILVAVLVAIALPRYMDAVYRGKVAACKQNISDLNTAIQAYQAKSSTAAFPADVAALVTEGFMDVAPICPFATAYTCDTLVSASGETTACFVAADEHFTNWKTSTEHL